MATVHNECWALWAKSPTLKYTHQCFYNDPVTLITTMHVYNHECWAHWAQGPTLMYTHACFYNDPVTLITTMHISTSMSAEPLGPRPKPNVHT